MTAFGASPNTWSHLDLILGLGEDLLPIVCRPSQTIASGSKLKSYGKVPCLYTSSRQVIGIPGWTSIRATPEQIEFWSREPDYGICLQTRLIRALDCDITDSDFAFYLHNTLHSLFARASAIPAPTRTRQDSPKFLMLFEMEGEFGKRTLKTKYGVLEFLSNGQQLVFSGTHKDGARYEWLDGLPKAFPILTPAQFEDFWASLVKQFAIEPPTEARVRRGRPTKSVGSSSSLVDPLIGYLQDGEWVRDTSADGRLHIRCPWEADHTSKSDATSTTYFPAGTGGYEVGHFLCLHAHCQSRTDSDFLSATGAGIDGFEDLTSQTSDPGVNSNPDDDISDLLGDDVIITSPPDDHPDWPGFDREKSGKIKTTLSNLVKAFSTDGFTSLSLSFDAYTSDLVVQEANGDRRPITDNDYTRLDIELAKRGFGPGAIPIEQSHRAANYVAEKQSFDSHIRWAGSLPPWDGVERVPAFCSAYLGCEDTPYAIAVSRYLWSALAGRCLTPGVQADMALVWISKQGTGKTSAVKAIAPSPEQYVELNMGDDDIDLARKIRGACIGEISELRGIATREMEAIKAWVSRDTEKWTPKYMEHSRIFKRRLVLIGTSNQEEFLADETGNRRWLPIRVGDRQDISQIVQDRLQLWSEGIALYRLSGVLWQDAERLAREVHDDFMETDPWQDIIERWLDTPGLDKKKPSDEPYLVASDILRDGLHADTRSIKSYDGKRIGKILRILGYSKKNKRAGNRMLKVWVKNVACEASDEASENTLQATGISLSFQSL